MEGGLRECRWGSGRRIKGMQVGVWKADSGHAGENVEGGLRACRWECGRWVKGMQVGECGRWVKGRWEFGGLDESLNMS